MSGLGALLGLAFAGGTLLVTARLRARRPTLDARLAPYLRARRTSSALLETRSPLGVLERLAAPFVADATSLVARLGSGPDDVRRRLSRAGLDRSVEQFRVQQVVGGSLGLAGGLAVAMVVLAARGGSAVVLVVLVAVAGVTGALVPDWWLSRQVSRREARMMAELPTVAELLALAVAAGEGAAGALERVVRSTHGELCEELGGVLAEARSGEPLTSALDALAARTGLPALARFAEGVAVALERGTPLADVLRAQAQDVREEGRQALMDTGGRKEVLMMVPVVMLILPVTVLFAVFPSLVVLRVGP